MSEEAKLPVLGKRAAEDQPAESSPSKRVARPRRSVAKGKEAAVPTVPADAKLQRLTLDVKFVGTPASRKLVLGTGHTFAALAQAILKAFGWEERDVYSFHMDGEPYSTAGAYFYAAAAGKLPSAEEHVLMTVGWKKGENFLFLYDYSNDHNFSVTVEEVEDAEVNADVEEVAAGRQGDAPTQDDSIYQEDDCDVYEDEEESEEEEEFDDEDE